MGNPADGCYGLLMRTDTMSDASTAPGRILAVDLARAGALGMMVVFHFVYDLELFGWVAPGTALTGGWRMLALATAGSFLFLAGVSLWLGHGAGVRWRGFWRRFVMVAGAAGVITVATWFALGEGFIFFGILHAIAGASLLGLLVLRVPVVGLVGLAVLAFLAPSFARAEVFDPWWFWWTGLQTVAVRSVDYVPLAPWFGPFLLGMALGRMGSFLGLWSRLAEWRGGAWAQRLGWVGRQSLWIYLAHQPVLIAAIWAVTQVLR
jgi:uncharacterized membrane protein